MENMNIKLICDKNRQEVNEFIRNNWFSTDMVVRGKIIDMTTLNGFVMCDNEIIVGLATYKIKTINSHNWREWNPIET